jgi:hypothetical protein
MNLRQLLRRQRPEEGPRLADDGTLAVVGSSFDPARPDAAVVGEMADAGVDLTRPLLLRHHLVLPDALAVEEARRIVAQEGYALLVDPRTPEETPAAGVATGTGAVAPPEGREEGLRVRVSRPQQITAIAIAQERSRMVGLAQRLGGDVDGWDVLSAR